MKRLVLVGAGHAHLQVLQAFAREPLAGAELLLVTPFGRQLYSGMVPGLVAGRYTTEQCAIDVAPLAAAARASLVEASAVGLDCAARQLRLSDGRSAEYDVLSLNGGAVMDRDVLPGAREHGLFVRPIEHFVHLLPGLWALAETRVLDVVVVGGGAAGVELALALAHRLAPRGGEERARIALVTGGPEPMAGSPQRALQRVARALAARRITVVRQACTALREDAVLLDNGARLACDAPVLATGAEAPPWLAGSGLALDVQGFVITDATLQSQNHREVFAAGDIATRADVAHARSGVYAVRAGAALALNLRRFVDGGSLVVHRPPPRTLNLISCGRRRAIVSWGALAAEGRWAWWWKDWIDRRFVARFAVAAAAGDLTRPAGTR